MVEPVTSRRNEEVGGQDDARRPDERAVTIGVTAAPPEKRCHDVCCFGRQSAPVSGRPLLEHDPYGLHRLCVIDQPALILGDTPSGLVKVHHSGVYTSTAQTFL
jgi:hypothetical protein